MEWWFAITALIIGAVGGFAIGRSGDRVRKRAAALQDELNSVNVELNEYRGRVTRHFARTAELVDSLAANSRDIYNHLAQGSQQLCDTRAVRMQQDKPEVLQKKPGSADAVPDADAKADPAAVKPDEGWYEILPEAEDRKVEEPVH